MKRMTTLGFVFCALAACQKNGDASSQRDSTTVEPVATDNTESNAVDERVQALTPGDQLENEADLGITQRARKQVMDGEDLSTSAKNVKIITRDGIVTLRGPVASDSEKAAVLRLVQSVEGVRSVDDQMTIAGEHDEQDDVADEATDTSE